jgi:predicted ATPase/transcriptional regulator with GAF, ATPase, and Fis domain
MVIPGYEIIQELSGDDAHILYRGRCVANQRLVLLKAPRHDPPSLTASKQLEHEYELLRECAVDGLLRGAELLRFASHVVLALEDCGGVPLPRLLAARPIELKRFFRWATQMTAILAALHKHEVIYQKINPGSILVDPTTDKLWLTDLHYATRRPGDVPTWSRFGHCSFAYLSPEQTGRMNRAVDYRTDFYALGLTFYELLTGQPPFRSDDPLELMHWHLAKTPPTPTAINPGIPTPVSDIVMKLLAKTAEERYQSAAGLQFDLERCAQEWAAQERIAPFPLGQRDVSDRFLIAQKLYGRERETAALLAAFDRGGKDRTAGTTMMLVTGYAGIGKTSLIQELYKPILQRKGYFIAGKFDQFMRSLPFGALLQAFRALIAQMLTESEEQLAEWRAKLSAALGANGGVLAEVIPEIELVIGKQPMPPALGPTEALNRFQLVIQNFVGAVARPEHPLVIFLDDLQWADPATLNLLEPLLTSCESPALFLLGAFRDNEVDAGHLLARTLDKLTAAGVELQRVTLGPLTLPDLTALIRDTLHGELAAVEPLAQLVLEKTAGNPFFVIQFLKMLKAEGFLRFDYALRRWTYELAVIADAPLTDNVIDLMTRKIQGLSTQGQRVLALAACIGNQFDLHTLAIVSEHSPESMANELKEAIAEGLLIDGGLKTAAGLQAEKSLLPEDHPQSYAFLHDRVQQAAYALIAEEWKQPVHLAVGRLLLQQHEFRETKLFDIVHHLNLSRSLISDEAERETLARLNLHAGQKARSATAYEAALEYLQAGLCLLTDVHWQSAYELFFALHCEAAECRYLCGHFDVAERQYATLLTRATNDLDRAKVYRLQIVQYENQARYSDALASARAGLVLFGITLPTADKEKEAALEREIQMIQARLEGRTIASLATLPVMTNAATRRVMDILMTIWSSCYILGEAALARLISATMVRLSLEHGNTEESAYGYVTHAITVGPVRADYQAAYEFGRLALQVNEQFNDQRHRAKIQQQFHAHVNLWRQPMHTCIPHAQEACRSGLESGDFLYAAYGASTEAWPAMIATQNLAQFVRDLTPNLLLIHKLKNTPFAEALHLLLNWARALQGATNAPLSLSTDDFDEQTYCETYRDNSFFTMLHAVTRLQLCYLLGAQREALASAQQAREIAHHLSGTMWPVVFDFWHGLTLAANYEAATTTERADYRAEIERAQKAMAILAESCPANFLCWSLLLAAERERFAGRELAALDFYERAVRYATETGNVQHQAIAHELYARFWLSRNQAQIAALFLIAARNDYARWGARAKVAVLERDCADLLHSLESRADLPIATEAEIKALDLFSVLKAAQAITSEIELEKLLAQLVRIASENAGAERGALLLVREGELFLYAEERLGTTAALWHEAPPLHEVQNLPTSIVNYVRRTAESVVLADARRDKRYAADSYIAEQQPRSVMCIPVLHQARLIGVFYLENNAVSDAFTPARIQLMQLLAAQAAIALENARLYDEMKQEVERRRQAEETLRSIWEGTAAVTGSDFFASLVRNLAAALKVRYAFITECRGNRKMHARTLAFWMGDRLSDNVEYDISQTPCLKVLAGEICHYPIGIQQLFPADQTLIDLQAVGYLGIPMHDAAGTVIGHLAVLDVAPMPEIKRHLPLLETFAARAGAELERLRAEDRLRAALVEVEQLKNQLHAENIYLQEEIHQEHNFEEIVGNSPALLEVLQQVERIAPTDATVLILGETGTGKELIARALHNHSPRRERPLVKVNCGAISAGLVESELFGHVKGAFTGATEKRIGRFELAHGGTLFLDEVGDLPLETQVKLLRVLQEGEFEPVGSSKTSKVDVRIIAATNRDLEAEVRAGKLRADLYYRLHVLPIRNPALRERQADIPQLAMFFLSRYARKFGRKLEGIAQETMELLVNYSWPGNIRELQNLIERGVVLAQGTILTLDRAMLPPASVPEVLAVAAPASLPMPVSAPRTSLEDVERQHILTVLAQTGWIIEGERGAAKALHLHPNTLRSRLKKLGIQRPK